MFAGRNLPRRGGQLITLYRQTSAGQQVIAGQVKTDGTGTWRLTRVFTGRGTFTFSVTTGNTLNNRPGRSGPRALTIR